MRHPVAPAPQRSHQTRHQMWRPPALLVVAALTVGQALPFDAAAAADSAPPSASASVTPAAAAEFLTTFAQFQRASAGEKALIEPAADALAALQRAHPSDLTVLAYAGAAQAMRANTTLLPWKKMKYADDGLAQIDKALAQLSPQSTAANLRGVPTMLDVKLAAANTFLALPGFFNRADRGARLLAEVEGSPLLAGTPQPFREAVGRTHAQHAERLGR